MSKKFRPSWRVYVFAAVASVGVWACSPVVLKNTRSAGSVEWDLQPSTLVADGNAAALYTMTVSNTEALPWAHAQLRVVNPNTHVFIEQPPVTNAQGIATALVRCNAAGSYTLYAEAAQGSNWVPLAGTVQLVCSAVLAPEYMPANIAMVPSHTQAAADVDAPVWITLNVTDPLGRPVTQQAVTIATHRTSDLVNPAAALTDASGSLKVALTSSALGAATVTAQASAATASTTVQFVATAQSLARSTLSSRSLAAVADGQQGLVFDLTLSDSVGRPVPYAAVMLASRTPGDVIISPTAATDANGELTFTLKSTIAGLHTVAATTHVGELTAQGTLMPGAASATQSTVALTAHAVADGVSMNQLTVFLADPFGNPVPNAPLTLFSSVASDVLGTNTGTTQNDGTLATTLRGTLAGVRTITASNVGFLLPAAVTLVAGSPNFSCSTLTSSNTAVADGNQGIVFVASIMDALGNPVPNVPLTLTIDGNAVDLQPAAAITSATGQLSATARSLNVQHIVATVTGQNQSLTASADFIYGPPSHTASNFFVSPSSALPLQAAGAANVYLLVKDSVGHAIPGLPVVWGVAATDGAQSPNITHTSMLGQSSWPLTYPPFEANLPVFATVGGVVFKTYATIGAPAPACAGRLMMGGRPDVYSIPNRVQLSAADINNDGRIDWLAMAPGNLGAALYINQGNAVFAPGPSFSVSHAATAFSVADINHDHYPEVIVADNTPQIITYFGSAAMTYVAALATTLPGNVHSVCTGDLNSDGAQDVVAIIASPTPLACILMSTGGGGYAAANCINLTNSPVACAIADFDVDGHFDVVVTISNTGKLYTLLGDGAGNFPNITSIATAANNGSVSVGYINNDIYPDIVTSNGVDAFINVYFGQAGGTFSPSTLAIDDAAYSAEVADLDHDGNGDIVVASNNNIVIFRGQSGGAFAPAQSLGTGFYYLQSTVADLDGDGFVDILGSQTSWTPLAFTLYNDGHGQFINKPTQTGFGNFYFTLADIDGDSLPDVATYGSSGPAQMYRNLNNGSFAAPISVGGGASSAIVAGDFNGDGKIDLATSETQNSIIDVLLGAGDGNFTLQNAGYSGAPSAGTSWLKAADLNHDGYDDIVYSDGGMMRTFLGAQNGSMVLNAAFDVPSPLTCGRIVLGDINNDGELDLVAACFNPVIWLGQGGASFGPATTYTTLTNITDVALGDMNEDGYPDALFATGSTVSIYLNGQDGTFSTTAASVSSAQNAAINVVDIDGDGHLDFLASTTIGYGTGTGALAKVLTYPGAPTNMQRVADINGDGHPDVVVQTYDNLLVSYLNGGCGP